MLRDRWSWAAAAVVLAAYVGILSSMPLGAFYSPDEGGKFVQMRAIRWDGGLHYEIPYRGHGLDPDYELYPSWCRHQDFYPHPLEDGGVRLHWPVWFPLAAYFLFAAFGLPGLYVLPVFAGWATSLLAGKLASVFSPRLAAPAILVSGLATPVAFYSLCFWEHTLATMSGTLALVVALGAAGPGALRRIVRLSVVFALLGLSSLLRLETVGFALAVAPAWIAALFRSGDGSAQGRPSWRSATLLVAGASAILIAVVAAVANLLPRHAWMVSQLPDRIVESATKLRHLPFGLLQIWVAADGLQSPILPTALIWLGLAAVATALISPWVRSERIQASMLLVALAALAQLSLLVAILPQPYLALHGFFTVAPFLVLGGFGVRAALVSGDFSRLLVGMTALLYLVIGSAVIFLLLVLPDGSYVTGLEWGTRNLLTLYPLGVGLSLAALVDYWRSKRPPLVKRLVVGLTLTLVLVSSLLQARGAQMLRQSRDLVLQWQEAMPANQPIVTDAWWLPLAMAPFYTEHVMYCTRDPDQLSEWAARAARADVDGFVFASVEPLGRERLRSVAGVEWEGLNLVSGLQLNRFRIVADAAD